MTYFKPFWGPKKFKRYSYSPKYPKVTGRPLTCPPGHIKYKFYKYRNKYMFVGKFDATPR